MKIDIVPFSGDHLDALRGVFLRARLHTFQSADIDPFKLTDFDRTIEGEIVIVALCNGEPVGFASWWEPDNFLHNLFIDPDYSKQGLGRMLLQECLRNIGRPARLKCLVKNRNAMEFYRHLGWQSYTTGQSEDGEYALMIYIQTPS